jgi:hypothetical protein
MLQNKAFTRAREARRTFAEKIEDKNREPRRKTALARRNAL